MRFLFSASDGLGSEITAWTASVFANTVPQPGALAGLLLGMGVLGLPGLTRRKVKLRT
jgi:hypothetical protein